MSEQMRLQVTDLCCRRGAREVFRGLTFTVDPGEAVILRGPNGVGKSSLLRLIAGFVPVADGDVTLGRFSLRQDRAALQERIAYAGHLDAVKPALSVQQNLAAWAQILGAGAESTADALKRFGLDHIADRRAAWCSAGQKRRLGLARLMVAGRPLWLLDEPTVSLDAESSRSVADLVDEHCASGGIALIATHIDMGLANERVLQLAPPQPRETGPENDRDGDDAFLGGDWT